MKILENKKYYEIKDNWESYHIDAGLQQKIDLIYSIIPESVVNILDVGCGNGLITNHLGKKYSICGLDRSQAALLFLAVPKVNASANHLPFKNDSFDLVFSSELLEHLDDSTLSASVEEVQRVARSYLIISVPNQEMLRKNSLKCPSCGLSFNVSYHLQTFSKARLMNLFSKFECLNIKEVGLKWRRYIPFLLTIRQKLGNGWFKIPPNRKVMCPRCENTKFAPFKLNPIILFCDGINKLLTRRHPYWLVAFYKKRDL